jgi:pimeloyl-ACP methyl ester carboxylesterase
LGAAVLVLLPGLGADARLFEPQRSALPELICPDWLEPRERETLAGYAGRMAEVVRGLAPAGRGLILGGVSLGGMLAAEMALVLKPGAVVLIGSALSPEEISGRMRLAAQLSRWMPVPSGERAERMARVFLRQIGPLRRRDREFLETMIGAVPFSFLRWAAGAMAGWEGVPALACRVVRIHGSRDRVIPLRRCAERFERFVVEGAGHLPSVSHAEIVNRELSRLVAEVGGGRARAC